MTTFTQRGWLTSLLLVEPEETREQWPRGSAGLLFKFPDGSVELFSAVVLCRAAAALSELLKRGELIAVLDAVECVAWQELQRRLN